jgi:hypothetical protein
MKTVGSRRLKAVACATGVAALLALTACSGGDKKAEKTSDPAPSSSQAAPSTTAAPETSTAPTSEAPTESTDSTEGADDTGKITEIKAKTDKGTDPVLGHSFEATGIALGIKGSGTYAEAPGNNKYVAIKIKATAGTKYYNGMSCSSFKLWDDKSTTGKGSFSLIKDGLKKAGLNEFERVSTGKTGEGWCAFYTENPTKDNLTLEYSRLPLKDSSGKTSPELSKKLKITPQG